MYGKQIPLYGFIAGLGGRDVSIIDIDTDNVIATIPVGTTPFGGAVNDILKRVYVTNAHEHTISVIDTDLEMVIDTIPI